MKREGVTPNLWVFPDKLSIYVHMAGEGQLDYHERGPQANDNREKGDQKTTFRGLPVFEAQSFDVDFTGAPVDLMVRERQCGEFFTLKKGTSKYIYDADADKWAEISWEKYAPFRVNNGNYSTKQPNPTTNDQFTSNYETGIGTEQPEKDFSLEPGGGADYDLLLFRPHQTYNMASAILAKGGRELGSTFHGHHDFMLSDDIIRKVHVGHYTFYSKSVVKRPKNYVIVEDIFSQGYIGGENVQAFGMNAYLKKIDGFDTNGGAAGDYVRHRNEGNLGKGGTPSIVVVAVDSVDNVKSCIDLTGRFHPSVYERFHGDYAGNQPEHYGASGTVYKALGMEDMDPYRITDADEFVNRVQRLNTVCFRGCEGEKSNGANGGFFRVTHLNQGHWSENVYPGCRKVRDGENTFLKDQNYQIGL